MLLLKNEIQLKKPLVWLEINTKLLLGNIQKMRSLVGKSSIMAVLKANAYGLGAPGIARAIENFVDSFGVVGLRDALQLREAKISKPIVNLGIYCNEDADSLIKNKIVPSVFTQNALEELHTTAQTLKTTATVWLKIDTGLTRLGASWEEAVSLIRYAQEQKNITIGGIYSTLTEDADFDRVQLTRFLELKKQCEKESIKIPVWSIATSEAAFMFKESLFDVVRLGISLFGYYPSKGAEETKKVLLEPVATYKTRVACIKEIEPGESVFYRKKFIAKQKTRIAILLPGYSYGLSPTLINGGSVLINGKRFFLVGGVSATNCFADIGLDTDINVNDEVVLFGKQGDKEISLDEVCEITKESVYECLSRIPEKVERIYI